MADVRPVRVSAMFLLVCLAMLAGHAAAQFNAPPGLPDLTADPRAVPPDWAVEGLRLIYYNSSSIAPGSAYYRDDRGDWVDQQGRRYSLTPTKAGHGMAQVDLLAIEKSMAVVSLRLWSFANADGPLYPFGADGSVQRPGESDWWIHPQVLANLRVNPDGPFEILRGGYKVLHTGKNYDNVVIIKMVTPAMRYQRVFDARTGLLLHMDSAVRAHDGTETVTRLDFISQRQTKLPWAGADSPSWLAAARALAYQGSRTLLIPGVPPQSMPTASSFQFGARGKNWAILQLASRTQMPGGLVESVEKSLVSGGAQGQPLWIAPEILKKLETGKQLDRDDALGVALEVGPIANGAVVLNEVGRLHQSSVAYDLDTGVMKAQTFANTFTRTRIDVRLTDFRRE